MAFYSGMALKRLQVLTILVVLAAVSLRLTYGILDEDEYNSIYSEQMREQLNHEVGRFPFLMPNVRPKTVSSVRIPKNQKNPNFTTHSSCGRSLHATPPCMDKPTQNSKKLWAQYGTKFYGLLFCIASYSHSLTHSRQGQENKREILTGGSFSSVSR